MTHVCVLLSRFTFFFSSVADSEVYTVSLLECAVCACSSCLLASLLKLNYGKVKHVYVLLSRWTVVYGDYGNRVVHAVFLLQYVVCHL